MTFTVGQKVRIFGPRGGFKCERVIKSINLARRVLTFTKPVPKRVKENDRISIAS